MPQPRVHLLNNTLPPMIICDLVDSSQVPAWRTPVASPLRAHDRDLFYRFRVLNLSPDNRYCEVVFHR
jgi:hypothetical protein